MAFPGRDHKKEKHSHEELLPLTTAGQLSEDASGETTYDPSAPHPMASWSSDTPLLAGGMGLGSSSSSSSHPHHQQQQQADNPNGLRPIFTEPNMARPTDRTTFLDVLRPDESPLHSSFSHEDMNKMFEPPRKFSLADLISNSEVVEAAGASEDRRPSKPSLSQFYHVDEKDYDSRCLC
eukprot:TRINITY_DN85843_c1_g1_i7.p1 TRINITY_DN85843_c1_g1~~TRINITY_DN85843_c1_g1_i7.p1  ORF type:complete len:179 (+),score=39.74 TRINITY_DN85843_c1_g1_i7:369-905(+)